MKKVFSILFFISIVFADPINLTNIKIDLNSSTPTMELQFLSFNLEKPLKLKDIDAQTLSKNRQKAIDYISSHIKIEKCKLKLKSFKIKNEINTKIKYDVICDKDLTNLNIKYNLFFEFDKTQSTVTKLITLKGIQTFILSPMKDNLNIKIDRKISKFEYLKLFVIKGMWHIWLGIDHILFLMMLLLSTTLMNNKNFISTLKEILKIVTAFTISHSITLSLSMFKIVQPDERIIETLIAFSVLITALLNIKPIKLKTWLLAFGFGFIHGFGFANALKELNLPKQDFAITIFSFNIGVEIGQIIIVLAILPIIYIFRKSKIYKYFVIIISIIVAIISILWMIDRWWQLHFMPF